MSCPSPDKLRRSLRNSIHRRHGIRCRHEREYTGIDDSQVTGPINPQIAINHTPLLPRGHDGCPAEMMRRHDPCPQRLLHHTLILRLRAGTRRGAKNLLQWKAGWKGVKGLEVLCHEWEIQGVRQIVWVDNGLVSGLGGREVDGAAGEGVGGDQAENGHRVGQRAEEEAGCGFGGVGEEGVEGGLGGRVTGEKVGLSTRADERDGLNARGWGGRIRRGLDGNGKEGHEVVLKIFANGRVVNDAGNVMRGEPGCGADAGEFEEFRRVEGTRGEDHLFGGGDGRGIVVEEDPRGGDGGGCRVEEDAFDRGVGEDAQVGARCCILSAVAPNACGGDGSCVGAGADGGSWDQSITEGVALICKALVPGVDDGVIPRFSQCGISDFNGPSCG